MPTRSAIRILTMVLGAALCIPVIARAADPSQPDSHQQTADPLVQILINKGILTVAEAGGSALDPRLTNRPNSSSSFVTKACFPPRTTTR